MCARACARVRVRERESERERERVSCETLDSAETLCSVSPIMKCLSVIELLHIMSCETLHREGAPACIIVCDTA